MSDNSFGILHNCDKVPGPFTPLVSSLGLLILSRSVRIHYVAYLYIILTCWDPVGSLDSSKENEVVEVRLS